MSDVAMDKKKMFLLKSQKPPYHRCETYWDRTSDLMRVKHAL